MRRPRANVVAVAALFAVAAFARPAAAEAVPHYSHLAHTALPAFQQRHLICAACHAIDHATGAARAPGAVAHRPCADAGCHGARMSALALPDGKSLCAECHEKATPSGATPSRLVEREPSAREFGWRINHRRHAALPALAGCDSCHRLTKSVLGDDVTVAIHRPGHSDCLPCHDKAGTPPSLGQCDACHVAGERPQPKRSTAGVWRVYEKFSHDQHRLDVRTARRKPGASAPVERVWERFEKASAQTLGCGTCHATAARAQSIEDMTLLGACSMEHTCMAQCHNGRLAFQGSGTSLKDCKFCHSDSVNENTPTPASHCAP